MDLRSPKALGLVVPLYLDDGEFDEDNTFLLSDRFKHTPPEVLEKNFGVPPATFAAVPEVSPGASGVRDPDRVHLRTGLSARRLCSQEK